MSFQPQLFLSNIKAKEGLARPNRFQVILPIPQYIGNFINNSLIDQILNLPNTLFSDITTQVLGTDSTAVVSSKPDISRYLALQCESAELPGKSLQGVDVSIYGPGFKVPYVAQYTETTLTFMCTNEFYERKLFDRWLEAIIPTDTNNPRFPKGKDSRYMTNIRVAQYDDFIRQIYAVEMIDAFPISVAAQPLSWGDDGFHRLTVQFAYQKYRTVYDGGYDLTAAGADILSSAAGRLFGL